MSPLRSFVLAPAIALIAGVALGIFAPLLGTVDAPVIHVLHLVLAAGWSWAALAFCVGLACKSRIKSAVLAPAALAAGVIAYYVTKLAQGEFREWVNLDDPSQGTHIYWAGFLSKMLFWCAAAIVLGLLLGVAGHLGRNPELRGVLFRASIPLVAIIETSMRLNVESSSQGAVAAATWNVTRLVAVAVLIFLVWHGVRSRSKRSINGQGFGVKP
ncbi:DUF6518 family protein [Streptomyces caatingaensis]|uniref:DUF6518 family protein n=1 Tax=Streptomyces caatingaensis TaxID=1678637 RepID=UPI0012FF0121|nr:DUF6518 family protein [Streptomyces caatingaensis]